MKANYTIEPTYTAGNLEVIAINQRATIVWEPEDDSDIAAAVGAGNGIGIQALSGPSGTHFYVNVTWEE